MSGLAKIFSFGGKRAHVGRVLKCSVSYFIAFDLNILFITKSLVFVKVLSPFWGFPNGIEYKNNSSQSSRTWFFFLCFTATWFFSCVN